MYNGIYIMNVGDENRKGVITNREIRTAKPIYQGKIKTLYSLFYKRR